MDRDFIEAVKLIAETPTSYETPGTHDDIITDVIIMAARDYLNKIIITEEHGR